MTRLKRIYRSRIIGFLFSLSTTYSLLHTASNAQVTFERTYGGSNTDWGYSVKQTPDGGYIIVGSTRSFGVSGLDVYLIKTDSLGDTLWTRTYVYGANYGTYGFSLQQTSDGGFIIAGYTSPSSSTDSFDVYLLKTDSLGNTLLNKKYGGSRDDRGYSAQETQDGGYIITGFMTPSGSGFSDVYLIKTDPLGDTLWTKTYGGGTESEVGYSVQETQDGGFIITGGGFFTGSSFDVFLIKTTSLGDTLWTKTYGGFLIDYGHSVQETQDGGFVIAGSNSSFGAGVYDVWLIKTDSLGDTLWSRTYGETGQGEEGFSIQVTQDGGFIITGRTSSSMNSSEVYLIKTDSMGDTVAITKSEGFHVWTSSFAWRLLN